MSTTLELTCALIELASLTPDDAGCQRLLADRLEPLGFETEWFPFGDVSNVLFTHGHGEPSIWFLGHTDVVPPGPLERWVNPAARLNWVIPCGLAGVALSMPV
jgi:succinyl-diaminopimelate desuccinylase